jgi:hypothetical protein
MLFSPTPRTSCQYDIPKIESTSPAQQFFEIFA